jgi:drug/metabolite transporter (DMT)-like permease
MSQTSHEHPNLERRAHLLTLIATLLVATSFHVGAAITHGMDSGVLTLLRFSLAAFFFLPIIISRYDWYWPPLSALARYASLSGCLVGFFWGMFTALKYTSALNTGALFTFLPMIAAGFSYFLIKERLPRRSLWALLVGVVGSLWVVARGDLTMILTLDFNRGDLIFLAATICMGIYGPLVKKLHRGEPMAQVTFWTLITGIGWLLLLSTDSLSGVMWQAVSWKVYAGIVYLAFATTLVTFFFIQWSTPIIGPTKVMSYTYLNPPLVLLYGLALGHDTPPIAVWPGIALVVAATVLLQQAPSGTYAEKQ